MWRWGAVGYDGGVASWVWARDGSRVGWGTVGESGVRSGAGMQRVK